MPIRGIDNQILITKSQDVMVDRARDSHQQGNAAVQMSQDQRKQVEHNQNRTQALNKSEHKRVNVDDENDKAKQQRKRKRKTALFGVEYYDAAEEDEPTNSKPSSGRRFDVSI